MTTIAGFHLITAAASIFPSKPCNLQLILTSSSSKTSHSYPSSSQLSLLRSIVFPCTYRHRFFPSFSADGFAEADDEREFELRQISIESRRLFVGNFIFSKSSSELSDLFSRAGKVDEVELICDRGTYRSRGFAFVTMATAEEAKEAIRMFDRFQIDGRPLKVNFPEIPKSLERNSMVSGLRTNSQRYFESPHKIFAGNLGWTLTSEALENAFSTFSGFLSAKVMRERDLGRSRGYGFVSFVSDTECRAAFEAMNGKMVAGRPLRLDFTTERPSSAAVASISSENSEEETGLGS